MGRLEELLEKQRHLAEEAKTEADRAPAGSAGDKSLVEQVMESLDQAKVLDFEIDEARRETERKNHERHYDVYQPLIRKLEDERDEGIRENTAEFEKERDRKQKEIEKLYVVVNEVKRILEYLRLNRAEDLTINDDDVETYRGKQKVNLDYIFNDDFLKIKLFIAENDKPKNKFSLVAIGRTIFPDDILKLHRGYGAPVHTRHFYQLEHVLRDGPSVEELLEWLQKPSQSKVLLGLQGDYDEVKAAYLAILEQYQVDDFLDLITDRCTCGNFLTIFDNYANRNDVRECGHCHQNMEKLKEVNVNGAF